MMTTSEVIAKGIKTAWNMQENSMVLYFQSLQYYQQLCQIAVTSAASLLKEPWDMSALTQGVPPVWCSKAPR